VRVLGVSCDFHDAAACVVVDGVIAAAAEEERFTRRKHDAGLPVSAIASCLAIAGLTPDDLDRVVFHEKPLVTLSRILTARQSRGPRALRSFTAEVPTFLRKNVFIGLRIEQALRDLGATRRPVLRFAEHHLSHAAAAYYPSPFDSAAVLTVDGIGEWATASIGRGLGPHLDLLEEQRYPGSLGLLYSMVTEYCGFQPNEGEYKLMGLAPYGEPVHLDALQQLVDLREDGSVTIDAADVNHWAQGAAPLERLLGRTATPHGSPPGRFEADLARSVQELTEDAVLRMARHAHRITGERRICLAGGVALNCVANGRLQREGPFDEIWVQPAAGDAGSAVGAALWLSHSEEGVSRPSPDGRDAMAGTFLGPQMSPGAIREWLEASSVPHQQLSDREQRAAAVADALADGRIVGWFEGRMEFGPRALGHRSILADPRPAEMQRQLNLRVKGRESFRPFAPAVLEERAGEWFDLTGPSRYMVLTADLREERRVGAEVRPTVATELQPPTARSAVPACTHVDHSARVQTVPADRDDGFRSLLEAFEKRTGCPVLLNTSFNRAGEPIVCTPDDAVASARVAGLDLLVLEDCLVEVAELPQDVPPGTWDEVPDQPEPHHSPALATAAAVAIIAVAGPAVRAAALQRPGTGALVAAVLAGSALLLRGIGDRHWWVRLATIAAGASGAAALGGRHLGAWAAIGLLATDVVALGHRPLPGLPAGRREALGPLVAMSLVAAWLGRSPGSDTAIRVLSVGMLVATALSLVWPARLTAISERVGHVAAEAVSRVSAAALGLVVVVLPWAWHRLLGTEPLRPGGPAESNWRRRRPGEERPADLWRRDTVRRTGMRDARPVRAMLGIVVLGATLATTLVGGRALADAIGSTNGPPPPVHSNTDPSAVPAAFTGADWYEDYLQDISWLWRTTVSWDPLAPVRLRDVRTRHINIVDGARLSWRPPACDCRRIRIWMYGGSTAFGLGQRDEHTIASAIARAAWENGIAVDIDNRGVVGDHHWEEANRLAWDLASLPRPDLIVFLDGINDIQAVDRLRERARQPASFIKDDFWQNYLSVARDSSMDPRWAPDTGSADDAPPGATPPTTVALDLPSAEAAGEYVAERYETARRISASLGRGAGVPVEWFWQPAIENRPEIPGEPPPVGREWSLTRYRAAAAAAGPEVHDISGALDGVEEPLYWDQFHTNERGASVVGNRMFAVLAPRLQTLSEQGR
jgi:carbamoyltransferase